MEHADNRTSTNTDGLGHGDGGGITRYKDHRVPLNGSYLLMACPHREPVACVARNDADLLRQLLTKRTKP